MSDIPHLIAKFSILQSALSRCNAAYLNCGDQSFPLTCPTMDYVGSAAVLYIGYFTDYLFITVELYVSQVILLPLMIVVAFIWMTFEIRGYQASLKSWPSLAVSISSDWKRSFSKLHVLEERTTKTTQMDASIILEAFGSPAHDDLERPKK